jgi:glutathione-regulated potassium-efflux system ancillary protein KefC
MTPEQIESVRRFGWPAFYGDASRLDLLRMAGAGSARVFVLAIDDIERSVAVAALVREHFPHLQVVARARNVAHWRRLRPARRDPGRTRDLRVGADERAQRARADGLGAPRGAHPGDALSRPQRRAHEAHGGRTSTTRRKLIAIAKQGRQQLEELFAQEREAARQRTERAGWGGQDAEPDDKGRPAPR